MVRIFFLPYLGNRSKSDPCSYVLFCLESHILSFPKVLQIPPESPCIVCCKYTINILYINEARKLWQIANKWTESLYCEIKQKTKNITEEQLLHCLLLYTDRDLAQILYRETYLSGNISPQVEKIHPNLCSRCANMPNTSCTGHATVTNFGVWDLGVLLSELPRSASPHIWRPLRSCT